jgi:hypothetical protein
MNHVAVCKPVDTECEIWGFPSGIIIIIIIIIIITYLLTVIKFSLGGSSPYTSTDKTN